MIWRRIIGMLVVFGLGIGVGALLLRASLARPATMQEAQRRALRVLEMPPPTDTIGDNKIVKAVERIEPTVVNIDTVGRSRSEEDGSSPWFDQEVRGKGSGVVLTADGYIVTNDHVINGASRIRVTLPDGHWYYARLIGHDPQTDLAVVRVDATNLSAATLGDSERLRVGEWSIAVGNPLGLGSTVTVGVISALNRRNLQIDEGRSLDGAIQTDAAINRGNSGGALADINGNLIGINTAILSSGPNGGSIGLGFAIPADTVRRVTRDLIAGGRTPRVTVKIPWIGVQFEPLPPNVADALRVPTDRGVAIYHVFPETPASLARLEDGDIILAINGRAVHDRRDVINTVRQRKVGETITLHILRPSEQRERDITVTVQEKPENISYTR